MCNKEVSLMNKEELAEYISSKEDHVFDKFVKVEDYIPKREDVKKVKGLTVAPIHPNAKTAQDPDVKDYIDLLVNTGDMLSDTEAGELLGVHRSTVSRWRQIPDFQMAVQKALARKHLPKFPKILEAMEEKALNGSERAAELVRDTIGLKLPEQLDIRQVVAEWPGQVLNLISKYGLDAVVRMLERDMDTGD